MVFRWAAKAAIGVLIWGSVAFPAVADDLRKALEDAYTFNPALKAQRANLEATNERVSQAISEWRPSLSGTYSRGKEKSEIGSTEARTNMTTEKGVVLLQPVFDGFGSVSRLRAAENEVLAARSSLQDAEQQTLLNAVITYMNVVRDASVLRLSKNNEEVLEKQLEATEQRFEVGEVTRTDTAQAEARLSNAVSDRILANGNYISSKAVFKRVVGREPGAVTMPSDLPRIPGTLEEVVAAALASNPGLLAAEYRRKSADRSIMAAKSSLLPSVNIRGEMSESEGGVFLGGSEIRNDSVTFNVSVPLYQSGAVYSQVRQSKKAARQREEQYSETRNAVEQEAVQVWEDLLTARATIQSTAYAVKAAEIALDGVQQEHQYGARTTLDVLDAEQELFVARVNLVRAQRDEVVAVYRVLDVMGDLTAKALELPVEYYDETDDYDSVKYKILGF